MGRYRKKPVVIEAFRLGYDREPEWARDDERLHCVVVGSDGVISHVLIETLEGTMRAECGDYIIRGVKGELYPCKPDIFKETYEAKDELKPCPFCGGSAKVLWALGGTAAYVKCLGHDCGISGKARASKQRAIEAWNTRVE